MREWEMRKRIWEVRKRGVRKVRKREEEEEWRTSWKIRIKSEGD